MKKLDNIIGLIISAIVIVIIGALMIWSKPDRNKNQEKDELITV